MNDQEEKVTGEAKIEAEGVSAPRKRKFKMGPRRTLRVAGLIIVALVIAYILMGANGSDGDFVATVNGEQISKADFDTRIDIVMSSSEASGIDTSDSLFQLQLRDQVLNELINTTLLLQAAADAGISADVAAVAEQYQLIVDQFGSEEIVEDTLAENGVTIDALKQNIEDQIIISAFISAQAEEGGVVATEEEIIAIYDRDAALQDTMPPLEAIYSQIEAQIIAEKTQQIALTLLDELRANAEIEIVETGEEGVVEEEIVEESTTPSDTTETEEDTE